MFKTCRRSEPLQQLIDQARLADTGFRGHAHDLRATVAHLLSGGEHPAYFGLASDEGRDELERCEPTKRAR
jgi:hypothetical protein